MSSNPSGTAAARDAALKALADYTGVSDPMKPWWNLNMPKALDIMLPAIQEAVAVDWRRWPTRLRVASMPDTCPLIPPFPVVLPHGNDRSNQAQEQT